MFIVMAIQAEQFPVAAVGRIVVVIMVSVVNSQFAKVFVVKLPGATPTYPGVKFQGLPPIRLFP